MTQPTDPNEARKAAVERINAGGQPHQIPLDLVDRHRIIHLWIGKSIRLRGLLRSFEDLCNLALDEPQPFDHHPHLLIAYDDSRLAVATGVNTAELAAICTDWTDNQADHPEGSHGE
jgi:hypothetical protein